MDTKPIFDYLHEIETRKSFVKYPHDALSEVKLKSWQDYLHLLSDFKGSFEACVFQCAAENPQFKEELHVIVNKLQRWIKVYENRKQDMPEMFDDSSRIVLTMAKDSLKFLQENYSVDVEMTITPKPEPEPKDTVKKEAKKASAESSFLNGKEVASLFGLAYNNIKDKKWRDKHGFPYLQPTGDGGRVVFVKEDVEEWVKDNGNRG